MIQRKQTAVVQLGDGRKVSGVQQVGKELGEYWEGIMQSPDITVQECEAFIHGLDPPRTWTEALPQLWKRPSEEVVITALEGLDPSSAPGEDGIPAMMYHVFADIFVPRLLLKMEHLAKVGKWGERWARGIMRTIPKEAGNLAVDKQRPITLLNSKAKWITGTVKLCLQDFLNVIVPMEQKGFMKGRNMNAHLHKVMQIQATNAKGAWV